MREDMRIVYLVEQLSRQSAVRVYFVYARCAMGRISQRNAKELGLNEAIEREKVAKKKRPGTLMQINWREEANRRMRP